MTNLLPACPYCDAEDGFIVKGTIHGPVQSFFNEQGVYTDSSYDHSYTKMSRVVRCGKCFRVRKDLTLIDRKIVSK